MNAVSAADREAAAVIGIVLAIHPKVAGLTGADQCFHALCGNGESIAEMALKGVAAAASASAWEDEPYRHHEFTLDPYAGYRGDSWSWCKCGNRQGGPVHLHCWEGDYNGTEPRERTLAEYREAMAADSNASFYACQCGNRLTIADRGPRCEQCRMEGH